MRLLPAATGASPAQRNALLKPFAKPPVDMAVDRTGGRGKRPKHCGAGYCHPAPRCFSVPSQHTQALNAPALVSSERAFVFCYP